MVDGVLRMLREKNIIFAIKLYDGQFSVIILPSVELHGRWVVLF